MLNVDVEEFFEEIEAFKLYLKGINDFQELKDECIQHKEWFEGTLANISNIAKENKLATPADLKDCFTALKRLNKCLKRIDQLRKTHLHQAIECCCGNECAICSYNFTSVFCAGTAGIFFAITVLFGNVVLLPLVALGAVCTCGSVACSGGSQYATKKFQILEISPRDKKLYKFYTRFFRSFTRCDFDQCQKLIEGKGNEDGKLDPKRFEYDSLINKPALRDLIAMAKTIPKETYEEIERRMIEAKLQKRLSVMSASASSPPALGAPLSLDEMKEFGPIESASSSKIRPSFSRIHQNIKGRHSSSEKLAQAHSLINSVAAVNIENFKQFAPLFDKDKTKEWKVRQKQSSKENTPPSTQRPEKEEQDFEGNYFADQMDMNLQENKS